MAGFTPLVTISGPARGSAQQALVQFRPKECVLTWSHGLQPSTGLIDWASVNDFPTIVPLANMDIQLGGHIFYGYAESSIPVTDTSGKSMMMEFRDNRAFLMWDKVFGAFNIRETKIVNGVYRRRYKHLAPNRFASQQWFSTDTPYYASQIMAAFIGAPTVETPWTYFFHTALNVPVYEIDYRGGAFLGTILQAISERCGTVFTLQGGRYTLHWYVKGEGTLPDYGGTPFPANSNNRRIGISLSANPTRITVIGDRNRYQVLGIQMQPDWVAAWQQFFDFGKFVKDIYDHERLECGIAGIAAGTAYNAIIGDTDHAVGFQLATARARTITVGEYAYLRDARSADGNYFRDYRMFNKMARLQMPVALYLNQILFRAFRLPLGFAIRNWQGIGVPLTGLEISENAVCQVAHNPANGVMYYSPTQLSRNNGYAIVQGYQVGQDAFKGLNPEQVNLAAWLGSQYVWQSVPFSIDNSGDSWDSTLGWTGYGEPFILFQDPIIVSNDLLTFPSIGGVVQDFPAMKANATVSAPPVRAALTFEAEPFNWREGVGTKDDTENVPGLHGEFIAFANGAFPVEVPFPDGYYAWQKASQILATLLNRQFYYYHGGYRVPGNNSTQLSSMIDRVTVRLQPDGGLVEDVDFTTERSRNVSLNPSGRTILHPEPERVFERRAQIEQLFPGQEELRDQAEQNRAVAAFLRLNPKAARDLIDTFHLQLGLDTTPNTVLINGSYAGNLPVGTPLFQDQTRWPKAPDDATPVAAAKPVFAGVTTLDGEDPAGPVRVTRSGNNGIIFGRVKGPVKFGDAVGPQKKGSGAGLTTYLVKEPYTPIGNVLAEWSDETIKYVRIRTTGAGGAGGQFQLFRLKSIEADYLTCHKWDGTEDGEEDEDIRVAKRHEIRNSIPSEILDGVSYTYTYNADTVHRTANDGSRDISQLVVKPFIIDDPIWAVQCDHTTVFVDGEELEWMDTSNRVWGCEET